MCESVRVSDYELLFLFQFDGDLAAYEMLQGRYVGFIRQKASRYFLPGGEASDLVQEGTIGFYKACRDYRSNRDTSFRTFAELCIVRQIISAVKTATRRKHTPLNQYVSFSAVPSSATIDGEPTLEDVIPGPSAWDPVNQVISTEEVHALVGCLSTALSELESRVLALRLDGRPYDEIARRLGCDEKTVDNAVQRAKRKVQTHLRSRGGVSRAA